MDIVKISGGELTKIPAGALAIEMFRSANYTGPRDDLEGFRPSAILRDGKMVWSFREHPKPFGFWGDLMDIGEDPSSPKYMIAIRNRDYVSEIVVVNDFNHGVMTTMAGKPVWVPANGSSSVEQRLDIKLMVAEEFQLTVQATGEEQEILRERNRVGDEARAKARQEEIAKRDQAVQERFAKVAAMMARKKAEGWAEDGKKLFGVPITDNEEWKSLPNNTFCMMMNADGQPAIAFVVKKEGSKVTKGKETPVSTTKPVTKDTGPKMPELLDTRTATIGGVVTKIPVFASLDDVKAARAAGLNSGTLVGYPTKDGNIKVVAVTATDLNDKGTLVSRQQAA